MRIRRITEKTRRDLLADAMKRRGNRRLRYVDESEIDRAIALARRYPKKRVRVYSSDGFVPSSYQYPAQIDYVEFGPRQAENYREAYIGTACASRRRGRGALEVVQ